MCTEQTLVQVVVCDVAISGVRAAIGELAGVTFTHLPYEGTRVALAGDVTSAEEFRGRLHQALTPYGGGLSGQ
jgi:hypothetical protein